MAIRIVFLTLLIRKDALISRYPGGLEGFRARFPNARDDATLVAFSTMSSGELEDPCMLLTALGFVEGEEWLFVDRFGGPFVARDWVAFGSLDRVPHAWHPAHRPAGAEDRIIHPYDDYWLTA